MKLFRLYLSLSAIATAMFCSNTANAQCDAVDLTIKHDKNGMELSWDAISNATGYEYAYSTREDVPNMGNLTTNNNVLLTGMQPDVRYCIFVRTRCNDNDNPLSEWTKSCAYTACTDVIPDVNIDLDLTDPSRATGSWNSNVNSTPGRYDFALTTRETEPLAGTMTQNTSVQLQQLTPGTRYCLHVRYYCPNSQTFTQWAVKCFTTPEATGISGIQEEKKIIITPNPASTILTIEIPSVTTPHHIIISDLTGRTVYNAPATTKQVQINTSALNQGIYFVNISGKEYNTTQKVAIVK